MRKFWVAVCTVIMLGATISVAGVQDPNAGNIDGDTNSNPWGDLFTTAPTTIWQETSSEEIMTTPNESSVEEKNTPSESEEVPSQTEETTAEVLSSEMVETTTGFVITEQNTTNRVIITDRTTQKITNLAKVGKVKIKKATKKKNSSKVYLKLKKVKGAKKYQIQISKTRKFKKILVKRSVKKIKIKIKNKKIRNKKRLYVRVRAIKMVDNKMRKGKWSVKKVRIKKK